MVCVYIILEGGGVSVSFGNSGTVELSRSGLSHRSRPCGGVGYNSLIYTPVLKQKNSFVQISVASAIS